MALLAAPAHAAGYHLLEVDAIYGAAEPTGGQATSRLTESPPEAGFGLYPISDQFGFWITFGDPDESGDGHGHRVKEWWIDGSWYGYPLGAPPPRIEADPDLETPFIVPMTWGRMGTDHTTRRSFVFDESYHLMLSLPGFWEVQPRQFHFGPTVGAGVNLTWWDRWKDTADTVVNTGKITGEAGWALGATWHDALFGQARATFHYDLFGIHQTNLGVAGVVGFFLGRLGKPFGFEVKGELDRGNDTVTTDLATSWCLRGVLFFRAPIPVRTETPELDELMEMLRQMEREGRDDEAPDEAPPPEEPAPRPAPDDAPVPA